LRAGASAAACLPHSRLVVTWHNAGLLHGARGLAQAGLARYVARAADLTLAASEDLAGDARRAGAIAVQSTFVAAPALPAPSRSRADVRAELGAASRPLVLAVGRLQAQKRLDVLIDAAAGWPDAPDRPQVAIAGSGPDRQALQARIDARRAPVRLLGARDDLADLLAAADVVALPSEWEARALVAQEALRAGVPLVTTSVGGLPGLVGRAAILIPVGDPSALRMAIEEVLSDPQQRDRMVALGRERASTWPDEAAMLAQLRDTYLDLNARSSLD
jgi:glycosyltransferase involved in cell wall biosynthesis